MDILISPQTFMIGGILASFFVLNEIFTMVSPNGMYLIAMAAGALVFVLYNSII